MLLIVGMSTTVSSERAGVVAPLSPLTQRASGDWHIVRPLRRWPRGRTIATSSNALLEVQKLIAECELNLNFWGLGYPMVVVE